MRSEDIEARIETLSRELFGYKAYVEDFDQITQDDWYGMDQEVLAGPDRKQTLDRLERFLTTIKIGRCKYCKIQMNPVGSTLADANGWCCPECRHEEVEMGSYSLGGRKEPIRRCRCENCTKKTHE